MSKPRRGAALALALGLSLCSATRASGQPAACPAPSGDAAADEERARRMFHDALAVEPSDPAGALDRLRCAERHADKPAVALRIGTIAERLGKTSEAIAAFEHYLELAGEAAPDRDQLRARIAALRERQSAPASRQPAPPAEEGNATAFVAGWVITGAGIALVAAGGVLLAVAKQQSDEVQSIEPGTAAWDSEEARGTFEAAERNQALGIAALAVGGAAAVGGIVLSVLTRPHGGAGSGGTRIRTRLGATGAAVVVHF